MACLNIPVGVSDFAEIRKNGYYYVDKSGLIEELLRTTATKVTLITRPRRFGKTLGMNMLAEFFDIRKDSRALFEGLEIDENTELCNRWMNQWPTIFFSLRRVDGLDFSGAYDMLCSVITELCDSHRYLLDSEKISPYDRSVIKNILNFNASESDRKNSLLSLTRAMQAYYGTEIREIFQTTIKKWFDDSARVWNRKSLFDAVWSGNTEVMTEEMNKLLRRTISYHDYKEDYYHAFLAGIFAGAGYIVESNKEHGEGRSDVVVYDPVESRAAVFEAKYSKALKDMETSCEEALMQIDKQMYAREYEDDYDHIFCYGISFFKKRCLVKTK